MTLLVPSRDHRNRFSSPSLHAVPQNYRNLPDSRRTNATDPLLDLLELSSYSHVLYQGATMLSPTANCPKSACTYPTLRPTHSVNIRPSYHPILSTQYDFLIYGPPTEAPYPKLWPNVHSVYRRRGICSPTPPNVSLNQCYMLDTDHQPNAIPYVCPRWDFYRPQECPMPKSARSLHCHDYTTVLSSIPWDQYQPHSVYLQLLTRAMHHQHQQYSSNIDAPTRIPHNCPLLYLTDAPTDTNMNTTAYLPALTTTFRARKRVYFSCPYSSGTAPPRPTTSDKNLLRPP